MSISTVVSLVTLLTLIALYPNDPTSKPSNAEMIRSIHVSRRASLIASAINTAISTASAISSDTKIENEEIVNLTWQESLKIFWTEIQRIFNNPNWRLLALSYSLMNGCIMAFEIQAVFIIRMFSINDPDQVNLNIGILLMTYGVAKIIGSWLGGVIADRFHNFKKLGLGNDRIEKPHRLCGIVKARFHSIFDRVESKLCSRICNDGNISVSGHDRQSRSTLVYRYFIWHLWLSKAGFKVTKG